jgi:type I restriction enzyme S subunit
MNKAQTMEKTKETKAYKYKPSGIEWLGDIPEHWVVKKVKNVFKERIQKGFSELPLLTATQTKGVVPKSIYGQRTVTAQKDLHLLKFVDIGDFCISLRSFQGGIEYAHYQGIISPAYTIIKLNLYEAGYFRHLFKSGIFIRSLKLYITGIREGQNIDYFRFKNSLLPLPPIEEQNEIAQYLDYKTKQINCFIKNKQKLIKLLKEQKQNIINQAVIKGTNKNVSFKPSGIEWLGDITEHWEVRRLKNVCSLKSGDSITSLSISEKADFAVYGGNGLRGYTSLFNHDGEFILIGRQGELCGNIHLVKGKFWASEHAVVVRALDSIDLKYFANILETMNLRQYSESAAQPGLAVQKIKNLEFPFPPLEEQKAIVEYIEKETAIIDKAIERTEREIELIKEYKTTLISEVVTGKLPPSPLVRGNLEDEEINDEIEPEENLDEELVELEEEETN